MSKIVKTELKIKATFDPFACRQYFNGQLSVLHCHHFTALYSQLADDVSFVDGKGLLQNVAEISFAKILEDYYSEYQVNGLTDRIEIAEQYFAALGLGKMDVLFAGNDSGEVVLTRSHVDEGWIAKWGKRDKPVNFIGSGYISALFCLLFDQPLNSFQVVEEQSIVAGAACSRFKVVKK